MNSLYPYQKRVYKHLMAGENVIVQAPTGAGKTLAALYPYFENLKDYSEEDMPEAPLPLTCRYAVPMRVLATQFEREFHSYFATIDREFGSRMLDRYRGKLDIEVPAIQTGETPKDPKFESPLTFCTIDQLLASFIGTPYSIGLRQANLNVGAVIGSYLILDEFHLYPLEKTGNGARMTTLAMLRLLKGLSPFVLMTATFSTKLLERLAVLLDARVVRVDDAEELQQIMQGRGRAIRLEDAVMTPEAILAAHGAAVDRHAGASLVVCNTVARAQEMYQQLREALEQRGERDKTRLILLHSRFTPTDRQTKSKELEARLGKDQWKDGHFHEQDGKDVIVVGTQVVEVGLNISAGVLHTELAPANSIIQRAGRCGRFAQQQAEVIVYQIPTREDGKVSYLPYDNGLCEQTWKHLSAMIAQSGEPALSFGFAEEQALIDAVHTEEDERMLEIFYTTEGQKKQTIMEVLATHSLGKQSELIRNVTQVSVLIHPEPEQAIILKPFAWESFGLHPDTLRGAWKHLDERRAALGPNGPGWVMKELIPESNATGKDEEDSNRETLYTWQTLATSAKISQASRICLPLHLATYDSDLGFRLLIDEGAPAGQWKSSLIERKRPDRDDGVRKQRSYVEHISGLLHAYDWSVRNELTWVAERLESELPLPKGSVDHAIRLALACHDIGKLSKGWQDWARAWQELLIQEREDKAYAVQPWREFLAKTDGIKPWKEEQRLKGKLRTKRPPTHACSSVLASMVLINQQLLQRFPAEQQRNGLSLTRAVISAIARHHTPLATEYDAVEWDNAARQVIEKALSACRLPTDLTLLDLTARVAGKLRDGWLIAPGCDSRTSELATWLGFVVVRALRLCDQRAEREW